MGCSTNQNPAKWVLQSTSMTGSWTLKALGESKRSAGELLAWTNAIAKHGSSLR